MSKLNFVKESAVKREGKAAGVKIDRSVIEKLNADVGAQIKAILDAARVTEVAAKTETAPVA